MTDDKRRGLKRRRRRWDFLTFARGASDCFEGVSNSDPRHSVLKQCYSFYVIHGGRNGGQDKSIVEVFYGNRPVAAAPSGPMGKGRKVIAEAGATLLYQQNVSGSVCCIIYPASAEGYRRVEDSILLSWIKNPRVLLRENVVRGHWNALMSYFEVSSLDGEPSIIDHLRVIWLMSIKRVIVDGAVQPRRCLQWIKSTLSFALTVGLAGFLLELLHRAHDVLN